MYGLISSMNTDYWRERNLLDKVSKPPSSVSSAPAQTPGAPPLPVQMQYPITATDFQGARWRELPERLLAQMPGTTPQQQQQLRRLYYQVLADYEKINRRSNIAVAVGYAVTVSLQVDRGRVLTFDERRYLVDYLNNALANIPQFNAMTPQQKQILYESCVLTAGMATLLYSEGQQQRNPALQAQGRELAQSVLRQWGGL
jgi:hypothetical protein